MTAIQLAGGIIILISAVMIIILALAQSKKTEDMSTALSGQSDNNFFGKNNKGTSREDALSSLTKIFAVVFIVGTLLLNILVEFGL